MFYFLTALILLASVVLVLLVIVQKSKGGGLASPFASTNNIMGVRKTTDVLEKATWWLFGIVAVLCIISTRFIGVGTSDVSRTQQTLEENATKSSAPTALPNLLLPSKPPMQSPLLLRRLLRHLQSKLPYSLSLLPLANLTAFLG